MEIEQVIKKHFDDALAAYTESVNDYTKSQIAVLQGHIVGADYSEFENAIKKIPSVQDAMSEPMRAAIDLIKNAPLTNECREEKLKKITSTQSAYGPQMFKIHEEAMQTLKSFARQVVLEEQLFCNAFEDLPDKAKQEIYDEAWTVASKYGHATNMQEILSEFGDLLGFANNVIKAANTLS